MAVIKACGWRSLSMFTIPASVLNSRPDRPSNIKVMLFSLRLSLSLCHPPLYIHKFFFLFYFSFSSPASLDLPLSLTSTRVSRCGLDKKKRKKKKKRAWDVSQWKWFPYGVEIFAFKRSLQRGTSSEKMRWCNVFFDSQCSASGEKNRRGGKEWQHQIVRRKGVLHGLHYRCRVDLIVMMG